MAPLAWTAIVIYPVGLIAINASLLFCARRAIVSKRQTTLSKATAFLHKEYEPHLFWWELVEMLRRFILIGIMVVVYNGSVLQLTLGTLCAAILLFFQVQAAPFNDMADDYLAASSSFSLLVLYLCSIGFKYSVLTDFEEIQQKMSGELKGTYIIDTGILTVIVFGAILLSLVFAGGLFLVQVAAEAKRVRDEAAKSAGRRLRYVKDNKEVVAPPIDERGYHTFLSHVWGTGQDQSNP